MSYTVNVIYSLHTNYPNRKLSKLENYYSLTGKEIAQKEYVVALLGHQFRFEDKLITSEEINGLQVQSLQLDTNQIDLKQKEQINRQIIEMSYCVLTDDKSKINISDAVLFQLRDSEECCILCTGEKNMVKNGLGFLRGVFDLKSSGTDVGKLAADTTRSPYAGLMLGHHLRRWPNIKATHGQHVVSGGQAQHMCLIFTFGVCLPRVDDTYVLPGDFSERKKGSVVWFRDQCQSEVNNDYLDELKTHIYVHVIDGCSNGTTQNQNVTEVKHELNNYRFYMSDGSMFYDDHITSVLYSLLEDGIHTVPVVEAHNRHLPNGSYVDAAEFVTPRIMAKYLHFVEEDDDLYRSYFDYRQTVKCCVGESCLID